MAKERARATSWDKNSRRLFLQLRSRPAPYGVVYDENEDSANHSDAQAVEVYAGHSVRSEHTEEITADYGTDDSQYDIQDETFAGLVDDLAADKASNQT
jgi:hypothetical protein